MAHSGVPFMLHRVCFFCRGRRVPVSLLESPSNGLKVHRYRSANPFPEIAQQHAGTECGGEHGFTRSFVHVNLARASTINRMWLTHDRYFTFELSTEIQVARTFENTQLNIDIELDQIHQVDSDIAVVLTQTVRVLVQGL